MSSALPRRPAFAKQWVLKGATAILARLAGDARHTRDIGLYRQGEDLPAAESSLRAAAATDAGDFFRFTLDPAQRITEDRHTLRVPVIAYLGLREFARFRADLVTDLIMTALPDEVTPLVPVSIAGITSTTYRAYPIADHIADKVCAMIEIQHRSDGQHQSSSRYHDLADLATIARTAVVDAHALTRALRSEGRSPRPTPARQAHHSGPHLGSRLRTRGTRQPPPRRP